VSNKTDNKSISIKSANLDSNSVSQIVNALKKKYKKSNLTNQENIGASIGKEARIKCY
jgi:preprotein translocase subunit SecF